MFLLEIGCLRVLDEPYSFFTRKKKEEEDKKLVLEVREGYERKLALFWFLFFILEDGYRGT